MRLKRFSKIDALKRVPLFAACTDKELRKIASLADEVRVDEGKVLTKQGAPGREFFVIAQGQATVRIGKKKVATLGAGECFGEMSLLDQGPRTATVAAHTAMTLYVLEPRAFASMLDDTPVVARKILRTLAERLRKVEAAPTH